MNTEAKMNDQTRVFERLAYTALAVDIFTAVASDPALDTAVGAAVVGPAMAVMIWVSARRGYKWAVGGLVLYFAYGVLLSLSELWTAAPEWLRSAFPPSESIYIRVIDAGTLVLMGAALAVYFSSLTRTRAPQI